MDAIEEKRIFGREGATETVLVAGEAGCVRAHVGGMGAVGEFSLCYRGACHDLAAIAGRPVLATDDDVRLGTDGESDDDSVSLGFGPVVAVGTHREGMLAASPDAVVGRWDPEPGTLDTDGDPTGEWGPGWELDTPARALAADLAATADGVVRLGEQGATPVGLEAVRDVAVGDVPLAATDEGVFRLGNGWQRGPAGAATAIAGAPDGRALAVVDAVLYARDPASDEWSRVDLPVDEPVVDVALGDGTYAITDSGTLLAAGSEGWRPNPVGLRAGTAMAVVGT